MNLQQKRDAVIKELKEANIYASFTVEDNEKVTILQAQQTIGNSKCLITLQIGDTIHNPIHYYIGQLTNLSNRNRLLDLINTLNKNNILMKYYLDDKNNIMARITYTSPADKFDAKYLVVLVIQAIKIIMENDYNKLIELA